MIYSFTASNGNLMAWGGVLRRINADHFYDLESNVIIFTNANGAMKQGSTSKGKITFWARERESAFDRHEIAAYAVDFRSEELKRPTNLRSKQGALMLRIAVPPNNY